MSVPAAPPTRDDLCQLAGALAEHAVVRLTLQAISADSQVLTTRSLAARSTDLPGEVNALLLNPHVSHVLVEPDAAAIRAAVTRESVVRTGF